MAPVTVLLLLGLLAQCHAQLSVKLFPSGTNLDTYPSNKEVGNFIINSDTLSCPGSGIGAPLKQSDFTTFASNSLNLKELLRCLEVLPAETCANGSTIPSTHPKLSVGLIEGATREIPIVNNTDITTSELYFHFRVSEFCIGRLGVTNVTAPISAETSVKSSIAIQSNHPALTLVLALEGSAWGRLRYVTPEGIVRDNGTISLSGDAAAIQNALANVTFTPFQLSGALQYINATLSSQSQMLTTRFYIAIAAASVPGNSTVINETNSRETRGNANGRVSNWHTIRGEGNVADYTAEKLAETRGMIAGYSGVTNDAVEIGAIQPGSVLIFFRFLGLDDSQVATAVRLLRSNCLQSGVTSVDCQSITVVNGNTIPAQSGSTDNALSAGGIVGIVIGSVVAGVIALALVLFGVSRSRKSSSGAPKNSEDPLGYTDKVTGITYLPPAAIEAPYPTPATTPVIGYH